MTVNCWFNACFYKKIIMFTFQKRWLIIVILVNVCCVEEQKSESVTFHAIFLVLKKTVGSFWLKCLFHWYYVFSFRIFQCIHIYKSHFLTKSRERNRSFRRTHNTIERYIFLIYYVFKIFKWNRDNINVDFFQITFYWTHKHRIFIHAAYLARNLDDTLVNGSDNSFLRWAAMRHTRRIAITFESIYQATSSNWTRWSITKWVNVEFWLAL